MKEASGRVKERQSTKGTRVNAVANFTPAMKKGCVCLCMYLHQQKPSMGVVHPNSSGHFVCVCVCLVAVALDYVTDV